MKIGKPFRVDAKAARMIRFRDLFLAVVIAFLIVPICLAGAGFALLSLNSKTVFELSLAGEVILFVAYSGAVAWIAAPAALLAGWIAVRSGWIGWAFAPITGGTIAGVVSMAIFFEESASAGTWGPFFGLTAMFAAFGAGYALLYWFGVRFLCPDAIGTV